MQIGPPTASREENDSTPGVKPYDPGSKMLTNLLRIYLKMSYRELESFLQDNEQMRRRLGLRDAPGRDTINRYAKTLSELYLKEFNDSLTSRLKKDASDSPSALQVSRSSGTRSVGTLPRTTPATKNS